jgi:hypothetical protein
MAGLLLSTLHFGQPAGQTPAQTKATISGTVVRTASAQPLRGVRVSLRRANPEPRPGIQRSGIDAQFAAAINAAAANLATVLTDEMGRFLFTGMDAGNYYVSAERDGFIPWEYGQRSYSGKGVPINVTAGQQINGVDIALPQASVVSGRVLNLNGEPESQITVQAFTYRYEEGKRTLAQVSSAQTNDLGEYRLFWLQPGEYFLAATNRSMQGMPTGQIDVSQNRGNDPARNLQMIQAAVGATIGARGAAPLVEALMPDTVALLYYPGTPDPDAAAPVRVVPAAEIRGVDFAMRQIPAVTVSGRVAAPFNLAAVAPQNQRGGQGPAGIDGRGFAQGRPGLQISLSRIGVVRAALLPGLGFNQNFRPDGGFEFRDVPPGSYFLFATAFDPSGQRHTGRTRVDVVNGDITNATVQLRADTELRGRIVLDGQPAPSFRQESLRVQIIPEELTGVAPALVNALAGARGFTGLPTAAPSTAEVQSDGTFVLIGIGSSDYRIQVLGLPNGAYVESGRLGSIDALGRPVSIQDSRELLEIRVGFAPGTITGMVYDASQRAVSGATAVLVPEESRRSRSEMYFTATTDAAGQARFPNVPAGSYKLFAWEDVPAGAWQYADFLRQYETRGAPVNVSRGGAANVETRVVPAGE